MLLLRMLNLHARAGTVHLTAACSTLQHLEKTPLAEVPGEPTELLDRTRYEKSSRVLQEDEEELYVSAIQRLKDVTARRGTPVKPFFDDAATDDNSAKLFGHVTLYQFRWARIQARACKREHAWQGGE